MLDNKILVNLYILSLSKKCEVFIPINDKIGNISKLLNTTLFDSIDFEKNNTILNVDTGVTYSNNTIIRDTDLKNGSKIMLI